MPKSWRKIWRLIAIEWSTIIQYRIDLILWTVADAMTPLVSFVVWYNVSQSAHSPYTQQQTLTYYLLVVFTVILTNAWAGYFLAQDILNGDIVKYLNRPFSIFWTYSMNNLTEKVIKLVLPVLFVILVLTFIPDSLLPAVYQPTHLVLFGLSIGCAITLNFLIDLVLGSLAFWLEDANEIRRFKFLLGEVSSGILIPLVMLPAAVLTVFAWLPFRYVISAPIEIVMGQADGLAAFRLIGLQLTWIMGLALLLRLMWQKGLERYAVPGQ